MANVLNKNPIVVDTLSAAALISDDLRILGIRAFFGTGAVAGTDTIVVQDKDGNEIYTFVATGANVEVPGPDFSTNVPSGFQAHGLKVPTLTAAHSNKLYVHLA